MNNREIYRLFAAVVFVLFTAGITWGHEVTIHYLATLGDGPEIQPGKYRIELIQNQDSSEVAFYKGRDLVARVPATLTEETTKPRLTEVHYETLDTGRVITQIRVQGWMERLVFKEPTPPPIKAE